VRHQWTCAAVAALSILTCSAAAQQPSPAALPPAASAPVAKPSPVLLKVQIVISRHQGEKTTSSQPYTLTATADGPGANLRMGIKMPVASTMFTPTNAGASSEAKPIVSYNYQEVGTNIDCSAKSVDGGRYLLDISLEDSWVSAEDLTAAVKGLPQFRSFRVSHETTMLRDGQTAQLTTAADKANGETVRIDVTMNVIK
jgi:hypothetical protein